MPTEFSPTFEGRSWGVNAIAVLPSALGGSSPWYAEHCLAGCRNNYLPCSYIHTYIMTSAVRVDWACSLRFKRCFGSATT
jgi:hypothetical protein